MQPNIIFTDAACEYLKKMIQKENGQGFRLTIKKTGCSGYSYAPAVIAKAEANDITLNVKELTIYLDPKWLHLLDGVKVDYVEEEHAGLKQKRLVFTNPNEASRCGCGESFHVE
jgi:iron-sulfur cluster assembly protein